MAKNKQMADALVVSADGTQNGVTSPAPAAPDAIEILNQD